MLTLNELRAVCKIHGIPTKNKKRKQLENEIWNIIKWSTINNSSKGSGINLEILTDPLYIPKKMYQKVSNELVKNDIATGRARPLRYGELHPTTYDIDPKTGKYGWHHSAFLGPGTQINDPYVRNFEPFDQADAAARTHDLQYKEISDKFDNGKINEREREKLIRKADNILIEKLKILNPQPFRDAGLYGMYAKTKFENLLSPIAKKIAGPKYYGHN